MGPRVLLWREGSVLYSLIPQVLITLIFSVAALLLKDAGLLDGMEDVDLGEAFSTIGVLLAFLMVFKTQTAYNQFWEATGHVDGLLEVSRAMAMSVVTVFSEMPDIDVDQEARRVVRLLALHYFVVLEYFQRTGSNATSDPDVQDRLRQDVRELTGQHEFKMLYPGDSDAYTGSKSDNPTTNPTMVIFWIQVARKCSAG